VSSRPATPLHIADRNADELAGLEAMPSLDAWLHRQQSGGSACMTTAILGWFEGLPPTLPDLRGRARQRLAPYRRLLALPHPFDAPTDPDGWPHWRHSEELAVEHHINTPVDTNPASLSTTVTRLLTEPLNPEHPPWQLHLLPAEDGFALLLRAHHALLDGQSLIAVFYALLDTDPSQKPARSSRPPAASQAPSLGEKIRWALDDLLPKGRLLPFHGQVGFRRDAAFSHLPGEELSAARSALTGDTTRPKASNTAVFLAAVAGALQDLDLIGRLPGLPGVCALVPVDVRTAEQAALLGNHYATVRLPLPTRRDPHLRLAAIEQRIRATDLRRRAQAQAEVVSSRPHRFTALDKAAGRYVDSPRYFSLLCSSVTSPLGGFALGAARLTGAALLPPLGPGHPLALTMLHHNAGAVVAAVTDPDHQLAHPLAAAVNDQIRRLAAS
jgi:diacylglycerol O-acyltransferase / wax synthase